MFIGGRWTLHEKQFHINCLEMLAILFSLKSFCSNEHDKHIRVFTDNATALTYIKHMGGTKSQNFNKLAKDIWLWCQDRNIWLSVAFIPGKDSKDNTTADANSRHFENERTEWMLNPTKFDKIVSLLKKARY